MLLYLLLLRNVSRSITHVFTDEERHRKREWKFASWATIITFVVRIRNAVHRCTPLWNLN